MIATRRVAASPVRATGLRMAARGAKVASVMWRLPPMPSSACHAKPACCSPSRTARAALQVAAVAPAAARRDRALKMPGSHIRGLRAGAKPSR